jgi:outer membrane lipoprotein
MSAALVVGPAILAGCAPTFPEAVRRDLDRSLTFAAIIQDPEAYRGRNVLVGGEILGTTHLREETELEVLERPLDAFERPGAVDASAGRFVVRHPGFLDSLIYAPGRLVTVAGRVAGAVVRPIGEAQYRYALLEARALYLWPAARYEPGPPPAWGWYPYWPHPWGWRHRYPWWW